MLVRILFVCLFLVAAFTSQGQVTFTKQAGPTGANVGDVEINSSSHIFIYAKAYDGGNSKPTAGSVYRSTNNGADWTKLSVGTNGLDDNNAYDILIDAADNIYVLGKTKIYKSTAASNGDAWTSFTPAAPFVGGDQLAKTADGELYLVNSGLGVFRSLDDGATWANISNNLPGPSNYQTIIGAVNDVYVGVLNSGTYKLPNNSVVWSAFNTGLSLPDQPASFALKGTVLYQTNRNGVYYYNTVGSTWTFIGGPTGAGATLITDSFNSSDHIVVNGPGNKLYVVMSAKYDGKGKIYYSNNNTTGPWTSITAASEMNQSIWAMKAFEGGTSAFAGFAKNGVLRTTDNGTTWVFSNGSFTPNNNLTLSPGLSFVRGDVNASSNKVFFIADGSPYLFTSNYGFSWDRQLLASCSACLFSTVYKQANGDLLAIGNQTYRSTDDGTTWTDIGGPAVYLEKVVPGSSTTYYGYNYSGGVHSYYKSSVATAATWATVGPITSGLPVNYQVLKIASDAASNLYLFLDSGPTGLYKVPGGAGTSATQITNTLFGSQIYNIQSFGGALYVLGYNSTVNQYQIAKTTDGGTSWTRTNVRSLSDFYIVNASVIIGREEVGNKSDFYYSNDAGATWTLGFSENAQTSIVGALINTDPGYNGNLDLCINGAANYRSDSPILAPNAPTNLQAVSKGKSLVTLEWDHDELYNDHFEILRRIQGEPSFTVIEAQLDYRYRFYEDETVVASTTYEYQIVAKSPAGQGTSSTLSVTTGADCELTTIPDNRSWTGTVPGGFTNTAIAIQKLPNDLFYISEFTAGSMLNVAGIPSGTYGQATMSGQFYGNCGQPFIKPTNSLYPDGGGTWTPGTNTLTLNFQIDKTKYTATTKTITLVLNAVDPAPADVTDVSALIISNSSVEISWSSGLYHSQYLVERAVGAGAYSTLGTVNYPTTKIVDNGPLVAGTTYKYRVTAKNINGVAQVSAPVEAVLVFRKPNFIIPNTTLTSTPIFSIGSHWADFNNDGLQDYLTVLLSADVQSFQTVIYKNLGNGDFQKITPTLENKAYGFGAISVADVNNDGFADIGYGFDELDGFDLYKGNGDFTFTIAGPSELGDIGTQGLNGSSSWVDINNDGLLDVFQWGDTQKKLFKQKPDHSFVLVSGGALASDLTRTTLALWKDYDKDGFQDVLLTVGQSGQALRLYKNNGNETFTLTTGNGFDAVFAGMAAWGDYNNDGNQDLFTSNDGGFALYKNNGNSTFTKDVSTVISTQTDNANVNLSTWGDYNNDGFLDLMTSGFGGITTTLYMRIPGPTVAFTKVSDEKINDPKTQHFGLAQADYDGDGFLDIGMSSFEFLETGDNFTSSTSNLFRNNNTTGNWSEIILKPGSANNKDAVGARIKVTTSIGSYYREISSNTSFVSKNSSQEHFGLGAATGITSIQVRWPNGVVQTYANPPINQILTIAEDTQGPTFVLQLPTANAVGVATNTKIDITSNEGAIAIGGKKITITGVGDSSPTASIDVTTAVKTGNTYSFTLPSKLALNKQYTVTLDAGAFTDVYGNASLAVATGWTFTTSAGPAVSSLSPAHNATGVSAATTLTVTFDVPVSAVAAKNLLLYDKSNLTTPVATLAATTGAISGNTVTFTLPAKLNRQTVHAVSIDAGAFIDASSNDFAGLATTAWEFTTDPGPVIVTYAPAKSATNVSVNAPIELTFDKSVTAVASKNIKIMDGATVILTAAVSTTGTIAGTKYSLPAPTGGWPFLKSLSVLLDAGVFTDANQNEFGGLISGQYSFTTVEAPDVIAPAFPSFTPPATLNKGFGTSTPSIEIVDNKAVTSAKIFVRAISGTTFTETAGTFNSASSKWEFVLSESLADAMGVQYYFEAKDASNNIGRSPSGTGYHQTYLKYTADLQIPDAVVGVGGKKADWKVIAIPFELPNGGIATVFDELGTKTNQVDYRIVTYKDNTAWAEYPSSDLSVFTRGIGYFINLKTQIPLTIGANLTPPTNTRDNLFKISLKAGWNMIGNPYLTPISWADVATLNGLTGTAAQLKQYNNGNYAVNNALPAYAGGFVFLDAAKEVSIPFLGQTAQGGRVEDEFSGEDWILPITISSGQVNNTFAGIGMNGKASVSFDRFDDVNPPRFFDFVEMNFDHPEHFAKKFSRDVVPTQPEFTWEFVVNSNLTTEAQLTWSKIEWSDEDKELFLLEEETQTLINMRETTSFVFNPGVVSRFKIFFGVNVKSRITPDRIQLNKAYPNPTNGMTTISFSLPEQNSTYEVGLEVYDLMGRKVNTLISGTFHPGFYNSEWDASVVGLSGGIYTYRLTVTSSAGKEVQSGKIMITK